jgi:tetratricopeptide (TPR) repeat protein
MSNRRLWIFRLITFILVPALLLGILEAGLRLLAPGPSTDFVTKTVVNGATVYRANGKFSRQFFPAEIAREPLEFSFPAEKGAETYRIFVLGGSAAQGDPEPTYGFSRILEWMLERRYPDARFEVVNTAVTAVNSHVVYRIAREIAPLQADLFVIYLGNNEVVGPYGAGTVFAPFSPSLSFIRFAIFSRSSGIGQNLARFSRLLQPEQGRRKKWGGMEMFLDQQVRADNPGMDKVYSHFRANLEDILALVHRVGANAIVSTVGTNLRDSPPFASQHHHPFPDEDKPRWDRLYQTGLTLVKAGRYAEAAAPLLEAERMDGTYADLQFLLGRCHAETGDHREAMRRYRRARDLDTLRFRADTRINQIIRDVASERASDGIYLVDAERAFEADSAHGIPGNDLFFDHVHMTFDGNYLLASALFQQVEKILPRDMEVADQGRRQSLTLEEATRGLALTGFDRHRISREVLQRREKPPFTNQLDHEREVKRAGRREEELRRAYTTPEALRKASQQYRRALQERSGDPWLHHNFAMLHYAAGDFEAAVEQFGIFLASLPHHAVARERLLASLIQLGRFEEAVDRCREALRIDPDLHAARYTLAFAYSRTGKEGEAIAIYRELLQADPERAPDVYNQLGQLHVQQEQYAEAIEAFREGIRAGSGSDRGSRPDLNYNLGVALKRDGQIEEAAEAFSRTVSVYLEKIERNPRSGRLHFALANVYAELRELQSATKHFRMAVLFDPADLQAQINLARSLEVQGRLDEALEALNAGVEEMLRFGQQDSAQVLQRYRAALRSKRDQLDSSSG